MQEFAGDVFSFVAAAFDDPEQDVFTDSYIRPFLQQANYRLFQNVFNNPNIQGAKGIVVVPDVPAGTTSLKKYLDKGGPLEMMAGIYSMREKPTGQTDDAYRPMKPAFDVPITTNPTIGSGTQLYFNGIYILTKGDIILPGANQALDMRFFASFKPVPIEDKDTPLIPDTMTILGHWVCEMLGPTRGATAEFMAYHQGNREQAIAELFNNLIMQMQEVSTQQRPFATGSWGDGYGYYS